MTTFKQGAPLATTRSARSSILSSAGPMNDVADTPIPSPLGGSHLERVNDSFVLELIAGQPQDRMYDVLVCVLDPDMDPKSLEIWTDWSNKKGDDPNASWSLPVVSAISKHEGLVLGTMGLEHIRGAAISCQMSVGVFSPSDLGSAVALVAAYNILYKNYTYEQSLRDLYNSTLCHFTGEKGTSPHSDLDLYIRRIMTVELRSSLAAFELKADRIRSILSPLSVKSFYRFQELLGARRSRDKEIAQGGPKERPGEIDEAIDVQELQTTYRGDEECDLEEVSDLPTPRPSLPVDPPESDHPGPLLETSRVFQSAHPMPQPTMTTPSLLPTPMAKTSGTSPEPPMRTSVAISPSSMVAPVSETPRRVSRPVLVRPEKAPSQLVDQSRDEPTYPIRQSFMYQTPRVSPTHRESVSPAAPQSSYSRPPSRSRMTSYNGATNQIKEGQPLKHPAASRTSIAPGTKSRYPQLQARGPMPERPEHSIDRSRKSSVFSLSNPPHTSPLSPRGRGRVPRLDFQENRMQSTPDPADLQNRQYLSQPQTSRVSRSVSVPAPEDLSRRSFSHAQNGGVVSEGIPPRPSSDMPDTWRSGSWLDRPFMGPQVRHFDEPARGNQIPLSTSKRRAMRWGCQI